MFAFKKKIRIKARAAMFEVLESRVMMSTSPNDASFKDQWALTATNATTAWDTTKGSTSVIVADNDTGMDYTHPDLYLNVWINQNEIPSAVKSTLADTDGDKLITFYDLNAAANKGKVSDGNSNGRIDAGDLLLAKKKNGTGGWNDGLDGGKNGHIDDIIGWDFANNDNNPMDGDGHGTHTAGTIAATGNNTIGVTGVVWKTQLMPVKIFTDAGESGSTAQIAAAIRYSADNGARVSNNSWGSSYSSTAIYNAISYVQAKGQIFVAAAGNDSDNTDVYTANYPANFNLANIISVGASDSTGALAYYSNYGKANVDVVAPGSNILSTTLGGGYGKMSGTSMATPHVTGAIALMLAKNAALTTAQVKTSIINGADQTTGLYNRSASGGVLNIANSLSATTGKRATVATTPVTKAPVRVIYIPAWWWYYSASSVVWA